MQKDSIGALTIHGGVTSHAAVVMRGMGIKYMMNYS